MRRGMKGRKIITIAGKRFWRSRYVMATTDPKLMVHHQDEDPSNDNPNNLCIVTAKEHSQAHLQIRRTKAHQIKRVQYKQYVPKGVLRRQLW